MPRKTHKMPRTLQAGSTLELSQITTYSMCKMSCANKHTKKSLRPNYMDWIKNGEIYKHL